MITVDNESEFASKALDAWSYQHESQVGFHPTGQARREWLHREFQRAAPGECLDVEVFFTLEDVREKLARWRTDYNLLRPHSALQDQAPAAFAADWAMTVQTAHASHELLETLT